MTILQTERLSLREMTARDDDDLCEILQDEAVMYAYEHAFSDEEVHDWLNKQLDRYRRDGFGLWAVIEKATGAFLGQAGLTMQDCDGEQLLEVGYLFKKKHWHHGYASEAAIACKEYAFEKLGAKSVYSIIRDTNTASRRVAERNGMQIVKSFDKFYYGIVMPHFLYRAEKSPVK